MRWWITIDDAQALQCIGGIWWDRLVRTAHIWAFRLLHSSVPATWGTNCQFSTFTLHFHSFFGTPGFPLMKFWQEQAWFNSFHGFYPVLLIAKLCVSQITSSKSLKRKTEKITHFTISPCGKSQSWAIFEKLSSNHIHPQGTILYTWGLSWDTDYNSDNW